MAKVWATSITLGEDKMRGQVKFKVAPTSFAQKLIDNGMVPVPTALQPGLDDILVAYSNINDPPLAWMALRPLVWCHGFGTFTPQPASVVRSLFAYAQGLTQASQVRPKGCIFQTCARDDKMAKLALSLGGVEESGYRIHRIDY